MRNLTLDPEGAGILVEFDESQDAFFIQGAQAWIIEVTDEGGVSLQAVAPFEGMQGGRWEERRTYNLSGAQYWQLVSGQLVRDPEHAGLIMAKVRMAKGFGGVIVDS